MKRKSSTTNLAPSKKFLRQALAVAMDAALKAGALLERKYGRFQFLDVKPEAGLVTEADKGAERIIIKRINQAYPDHSFLAEESGVTEYLRSNARWIIDPLDGTTNFVHAFPMFCVSIGFELDGELLLGVIHHPLRRETYWAIKGQGAFRNGKRIHVSKTKKLSDAMLSTGFSYRRESFLKKEIQTFSQVVKKSRAVRRVGSAALDLCFVACGQFDGFFEQGLSPWDVAAGLVILTEAGGNYSDFSGDPYRLGAASIVATNGLVHKELLKTIEW